jgi:tRNA pseudouridine13 synthase
MRVGERPEDFVVEEIPLYAPSGEGAHTFVHVEKRGLSTEEAARRLARLAGVAPREVGYAGRKDRAGVTRQWLSVPGLAPERALGHVEPDLRVLAAARHPHRLRTGHLAGNRFHVVVRGLAPERAAGAAERLGALARGGMRNRFGAQRFAGDGIARARTLLAGAATPRDRRAARFWLSALQALAFNEVLARRPLAPGVLEAGDVAYVHASGASFVVEDAAREAPRAASFEISPSGPLFGTRLLEPRAAPGVRERAVLDELGIPARGALRAPRGIRLRGARRPLRVRPEEASCERLAPDAVRLCFRLPPGSYATVLVEELFGASDDRPGTLA